MVDHETIEAALVAALADLTVVEAGRKASIPTKDGGKYTYDYADLGDVVKVTRPVLAEHGIVALTPIHDHGSGLACTVTLIHDSGGRLDLGPFPFPHGRDAQATGSMVTYHRRYALVAALGMAVGEDDDGANAVARDDRPQQQPAEDPSVPGLRTAIDGAIGKLDDQAKASLKTWFEEHNLPPVKRMNAQQCDLVLDHLMSLPAPQPNIPATNGAEA